MISKDILPLLQVAEKTTQPSYPPSTPPSWTCCAATPHASPPWPPFWTPYPPWPPACTPSPAPPCSTARVRMWPFRSSGSGSQLPMLLRRQHRMGMASPLLEVARVQQMWRVAGESQQVVCLPDLLRLSPFPVHTPRRTRSHTPMPAMHCSECAWRVCSLI